MHVTWYHHDFERGRETKLSHMKITGPAMVRMANWKQLLTKKGKEEKVP